MIEDAAMRIVARHTVEIRNSTSSCGNCSLDADTRDKTVCGECGTRWLFMTYGHSTSEPLEAIRAWLEGQYDFVFIGTSTNYDGCGLVLEQIYEPAMRPLVDKSDKTVSVHRDGSIWADGRQISMIKQEVFS